MPIHGAHIAGIVQLARALGDPQLRRLGHGLGADLRPPEIARAGPQPMAHLVPGLLAHISGQGFKVFGFRDPHRADIHRALPPRGQHIRKVLPVRSMST